MYVCIIVNIDNIAALLLDCFAEEIKVQIVHITSVYCSNGCELSKMLMEWNWGE